MKVAGCTGQRGKVGGTTRTEGCSREPAPLTAGQGVCRPGLLQPPLAPLLVLCWSLGGKRPLCGTEHMRPWPSRPPAMWKSEVWPACGSAH